MTTRDPRVDPQPGDVTRHRSRQSRCVVYEVGALVHYALVNRSGDVTPDFVTLADWRDEAKTDAVEAVGGRPVDPDTFPALVSA